MPPSHLDSPTRPAARSASREPASGADSGDPIAFLRRFEGEARGFWGRGDRWVAWGGEVARIHLPAGGARGGDRGAGDGRAGGRSRFDRVREEGARIALALSPEAEGYPFAGLRFFGGFAFDADAGDDSRTARGDDDVWRGFGSATFVLPRVLLVGRAGEIRRHAWRADGPAGEDRDRAAGPGPRSPRAARLPGGGPDEGWNRGVARALDEIRAGAIRKVVLARARDLASERPVRPLEALRALREENDRAHVFLFEPVPGRTFLGAAPEILARLDAGNFEATAVAGSAPRGDDPASDEELARALLASAKDQAEYRLTLDEMVAALDGRLAGMEFDGSPSVLRLAVIQHLETVIRGRAVPGQDILSLVEALHPTPAVCGSPREAALALIRAEEPHPRGWYSGPVGWFDSRGDGDFVPALRSAVGGGTAWRLFAGAGIVEGSAAAAEWAETELKLEPARRALEAGALDPGARG